MPNNQIQKMKLNETFRLITVVLLFFCWVAFVSIVEDGTLKIGILYAISGGAVGVVLGNIAWPKQPKKRNYLDAGSLELTKFMQGEKPDWQPGDFFWASFGQERMLFYIIDCNKENIVFTSPNWLQSSFEIRSLETFNKMKPKYAGKGRRSWLFGRYDGFSKYFAPRELKKAGGKYYEI